MVALNGRVIYFRFELYRWKAAVTTRLGPQCTTYRSNVILVLAVAFTLGGLSWHYQFMVMFHG